MTCLFRSVLAAPGDGPVLIMTNRCAIVDMTPAYKLVLKA
jgi:hypothetical protein